jgi:hypothetical protein
MKKRQLLIFLLLILPAQGVLYRKTQQLLNIAISSGDHNLKTPHCMANKRHERTYLFGHEKGNKRITCYTRQVKKRNKIVMNILMIEDKNKNPQSLVNSDTNSNENNYWKATAIYQGEVLRPIKIRKKKKPTAKDLAVFDRHIKYGDVYTVIFTIEDDAEDDTFTFSLEQREKKFSFNLEL